MMRAIQVLHRMVLYGREVAGFTASDHTDRQLRALMGDSLPSCAVNVRRRVQRRRHDPQRRPTVHIRLERGAARQPAELAALEARPSVGPSLPLQTPTPDGAAHARPSARHRRPHHDASR